MKMIYYHYYVRPIIFKLFFQIKYFYIQCKKLLILSQKVGITFESHNVPKSMWTKRNQRMTKRLW